ncbi:MAG: D-Ala-D-Ala carboxypeptidase family metallohydrolase [Desulfarculaceae bacterium]
MTASRSQVDWGAAIEGAPHFTLNELIASGTAAAYGLDNRPGPETRRRLRFLAATLLEPVRRQFGPLLVLSGYRSPEVNWFVSLSRTSRHCRGEAADVRPAQGGRSLLEIVAFVHDNLSFQEMIAEYLPAGWIHLACRVDGPPARRLKVQNQNEPLRDITLPQLREMFSNSEMLQ